MASMYVVVGPPAVGKSTTSRALATHFGKSVHIPVDDLRHMVISGLVLPGHDWTDALTEQVTLARESAITMAFNYSRAGFTVVIDDLLDPHKVREYQTLSERPDCHGIVLWPKQDEAHRRNLQREGSSPVRDYLDEGIHFVYQNLKPHVDELAKSGWTVLDNSSLTVEASVTHIVENTLT